MIPKYQRIAFWTLGGGILLAFAFLLYGCEEAHRHLAADADETPISAPTPAMEESVSFFRANDADGSITVESRSVPLPSEPTSRARALLQRLLSDYALPDSTHKLQTGPAINDVFLLDLPLSSSNNTGAFSRSALTGYTGKLAIINLRGSFAASHPSGVEVESLTLMSLIGTLHANLPNVTEVRFLVDGQPRDTLAGHADLLRTYPATDTASRPVPPSADAARPPEPAQP